MGAVLTVNSVACVASLLTLALVAGLIWFGKLQIAAKSYDLVRFCLAIAACLYATYCIWWLVTHVVIPADAVSSTAAVCSANGDCSKKPILTQDLKLQLIYISIVWIIVPPVWFFVEYFAVASNCISGFLGSEQNLKRTKDYADYASKIWAGVIALTIAVVALTK